MWAREVVAHKDYDSKKIDNDIAVLKLPSQVNGAYISPVRLPSYSQVGETFNGETVRVSGWGRTSDCEFSLFLIKKKTILFWEIKFI